MNNFVIKTNLLNVHKQPNISLMIPPSHNRVINTEMFKTRMEERKSGSETQQVIKKVLIIYSSGSIGTDFNMIIEKGYLKEVLKNNLYLCDYQMTNQLFFNTKDQQVLVSPRQSNGVVLQYKVVEMSSIQSSIYANISFLKELAQLIYDSYGSYDSFIVLSGLDLVCYVATAISFMLQNLSKLIIFTGGYLPLVQMRNDSCQNLVESFEVISQAHNLKEVIIINKNYGYRACRSVNATQGVINSIQSPNMEPLIQINIRITLNQHLYFSPTKGQFQIFTDISEKVKVLHYNLYQTQQSLDYQLANPHVKGFVIESYGSSNIPTTPILNTFKQYAEAGKIFLNISQCMHSTNQSLMSSYLSQYGIYYGGDMTKQAALSKLSYLIGKQYSKAEIELLLKTSIRGELTQLKQQQQFQLQSNGFMETVNNILQNHFPTESQQKLQQQLISYLAHFLPKNCTIATFNNIFKDQSRLNLSNQYTSLNSRLKQVIDQSKLVHKVVKDRNIQLLNYFLNLGADANIQDSNQCSPIYYALQIQQKTIIRSLMNRGGRVICPIDYLFELFVTKLRKDEHQFFELLFHMEFKTTLETIINTQKRNIGHLAIILEAYKCCQLLKNKYKFTFNKKDIYGFNGFEYCQKLNNDKIRKLFK